MRAFRRCHALDSAARDHLGERIRGSYTGLSRGPETLAPDALLDLIGYLASVEAEQLALCFPAERNTSDPQDLAASQINWLRSIDNRGDYVRGKIAEPSKLLEMARTIICDHRGWHS